MNQPLVRLSASSSWRPSCLPPGSGRWAPRPWRSAGSDGPALRRQVLARRGASGDSGDRPQAPFRNRRVSRVSMRARAMFLLPLPLLFAGLGAIQRGSAGEMLGEIGAFAGLMLSAWLLNEGLRAEDAYDARAVARPPAVPRKLFAAILTGASVALAGVTSLGQPLIGRARLRRRGRGGAPSRLRVRPDEEEGPRRRRRVRHRPGRPRHRPGRGAGAPDRRRLEAHRRPAARGPASSGSATRRARSSGWSSATRATSAGRGPSSASTCSACATRRSSSPTSGAAARTREARKAYEDSARRSRAELRRPAHASPGGRPQRARHRDRGAARPAETGRAGRPLTTGEKACPTKPAPRPKPR